jgi:sugar phosphate isomerase/epimerase
LGQNASAALALVSGFDARLIGVFADPGHLSLSGEPIPMALSLLGEYLSVLALKDLRRDGPEKDRVVPMGEGFVNWKLLAGTLQKIQFEGPLSFHCEYEGLPVEKLIAQAMTDVRYFNGLFKA